MLGGAVASVTDAHPNPVQIFQLWQIYISNINPLLKISHIPTLQAQIVAASADLAHVAPELEAFMFAMYLLSTVSLDEEQVRASFNEDKTSMIARFNAACQQALINAGFMRSNSIMVLQAFLLYLVRDDGD